MSDSREGLAAAAARVVAERGAGALRFPRALRAMLLDAAGGAAREAVGDLDLLVATAEAGVTQLAPPVVATEAAVAHLADHVATHRSVAPVDARWAVDTWLAALGAVPVAADAAADDDGLAPTEPYTDAPPPPPPPPPPPMAPTVPVGDPSATPILGDYGGHPGYPPAPPPPPAPSTGGGNAWWLVAVLTVLVIFAGSLVAIAARGEDAKPPENPPPKQGSETPAGPDDTKRPGPAPVPTGLEGTYDGTERDFKCSGDAECDSVTPSNGRYVIRGTGLSATLTVPRVGTIRAIDAGKCAKDLEVETAKIDLCFAGDVTGLACKSKATTDLYLVMIPPQPAGRTVQAVSARMTSTACRKAGIAGQLTLARRD